MVFRLSPKPSFRTRSQTRRGISDRARHPWWRHARWACLIATAGLAAGCMTSNDELRFIGDARDITYYRDQATKVDYPDYAQQSPDEVTQAEEPRRLGHLKKDQIEDLSLEDALRTALMNAEVIRDNSQFLNPGNRLLSNPDFATSIHDIAIQETNQLFGQGGVAAALAEFDATFTANMTWGRSDAPVDAASVGVGLNASGVTTEFGDFRSQLQKIFGNGTQISLEHNWLYNETSALTGGSRRFNSQFGGSPAANQDGGLPNIEAGVTIPLLQGAGTKYTRIAGPVTRRPTLQSTPTVNQGVVIARIRTDISLTEFEASVAQMLHDTEETYWDLYLSYRTYDAETVATRSALQTWREVRANFEAGNVGEADEAQARDNYFESRARREDGLANLYLTEVRLRRLMGLSVNDGQVLRPTDDPVTAEVRPDWNVTLTEALTSRPELRRQKWNIKSMELQLDAAEMLVRPRLDFVARYQINGLGDRLTGGGAQFRSAYDTLWNGDFTGWGAGFQFSMPLGFRGATTQVQNIEHRLSKARSMLAEQEQEISYELASVFQQIAQTYQTAKTNFNRRNAAKRRVQAFEEELRASRTTVDMLLRSQISMAQAEIAYYSSLVSYNRSINDLNFRKGTILMDRNVFLSESLWEEDAYDDAMRRAWERSFAFDAPYLQAEPGEFVLDCIDCEAPDEWMDDPQPIPETSPIDAVPTEQSLPGSPVVPAPTDPAAPKDAKPDNRSALLDSETEVGGLGLKEAPLTPQNLLPAKIHVEEATTKEASDLSVPVPDDAAFLPAVPIDRPQTPPAEPPAVPGISDSSFDPFTDDEFAPPLRLNDVGSDVSDPFENVPTEGSSRSQLLQDSLRPAPEEFLAPQQGSGEFGSLQGSRENDRRIADAGPMAARRLSDSSDESRNDLGVVHGDGVARPDGAAVTSAEFLLPADQVPTGVRFEPPAKRTKLPRWGRFFRREEK